MMKTRSLRPRRLTLFGRSLLLIFAELASNVALWIVSGLLFARSRETRGVLSLCILAWTLGLRHALDADHISAIDNATRGLMSLGQLPVTCGLFFSLGHSTIVIVVNVAIAISTDVYDKIGGIGDVGGVVGSAVSASFLFLIGTANSVILWRVIRRRREDWRRQQLGLPAVEHKDGHKHGRSLILRLLGPITRFVNRPWKMYPVGVLFGFGFDTASSIALLAVTALAKKNGNGQGTISQSDIIILPLLFTAGMTLVDSTDSIVMLYSYAGFPERGWGIWEKEKDVHVEDLENRAGAALPASLEDAGMGSRIEHASSPGSLKDRSDTKSDSGTDTQLQDELISPIADAEVLCDPSTSQLQNNARNELSPSHMPTSPEKSPDTLVTANINTMSNLSILLTILSILVAFSISLITIMGLIGDECGRCRKAAADDRGLEGRWWRVWAKANDESGLIGAAIVGTFVLIVAIFYGVKWVKGRWVRE